MGVCRIEHRSVTTSGVVAWRSRQLAACLGWEWWRVDRVLGRRLSRAPHRAMWRRCQADTKELSAGYARAKFAVNVSHSIRPSRKCQDAALRGGAVNARSRARNSVAVGALRRGIDRAEHSATIRRVMAGEHQDSSRKIQTILSQLRRALRREFPPIRCQEALRFSPQKNTRSRDVSNPGTGLRTEHWAAGWGRSRPGCDQNRQSAAAQNAAGRGAIPYSVSA